MGITESYENAPLSEHLSQLLEGGDIINIKFWNTLLQLGQKREYRARIPPKLLIQISKSQPNNVIKLLHVCITYLETLPSKNSKEYIGVFFYKQLNTVLQLTVSFFIVTSIDKSLFELNQRLFNSPSGNPSLGERLIKALANLLFCKNITIPESSDRWDTTYKTSTRYDESLLDVLHALLLFYSREAFSGVNEIHYENFLLIPNFPYKKFIENLCNYCNMYLRGIVENSKNVTKESIICHSICLISEFFYFDSLFKEMISNTSSEILEKAFFYEIPITAFQCPLSVEGLTFLNLVLIGKPGFNRYLSSRSEGIKITESILSLILRVYETAGISYIHTIAISCLISLLSCNEAENIVNAKFQEHSNETISSILIMILIKISSEELMISILCLIHTISPHIKNFSEETARTLLIFVQGLITRSDDPKISTLLQIVVDIFAQVIVHKAKENQILIHFIASNFKIIHCLPDCPAKSLLLDYIQNLDIISTFNVQSFKLMSTNHLAVGANMIASWPAWCFAIFSQNALIEMNPSNSESK